MKSQFTTCLLLAAGLGVAGATPAGACEQHGVTSAAWNCSSPARLAPRHDPGAARMAITTEDGSATLLLTHDVVAMQLSDRLFKRIDRRFHEEQDEDNGALGAVIKSAVFASVRSVLDHSAECPIRHIRTATYRDGRLQFETDQGQLVFSSVRINEDEDTLSGFSERDALAFVREFWHVKNDH
jgi:hypothetical protein